jgi:hypothetical protein
VIDLRVSVCDNPPTDGSLNLTFMTCSWTPSTKLSGTKNRAGAALQYGLNEIVTSNDLFFNDACPFSVFCLLLLKFLSS